MSLSPDELARYSRHLALAEVGRAGQERLRAARVLIVGTGGLGAPAALYLAASGIGTLGLVDCDRVELSNLQRQVLFGTEDVGQPKALAAERRLAALNPEIKIVAHALELCAANVSDLIAGYDVILDGTDRFATRYLVNDACVILGKPLVTAAIHRFEGQLLTYVPGQGACYRCLFPDAAGGDVASCAEAGVLGVLPGVIGTLQATEAIKLVLGRGAPLCGRLLTYDALDMRFQEFPVSRRRDCAVCGERPTIRAPAEAALAGEQPAAGVRRLGPAGLVALLAASGAGGPAVRLIDVREPHEFAVGHLADSDSVPLAEFERGAGSFDPAAVTVFICRSGARSLRACQIAAARGFGAPANLDGGLLAWAASVDASLPVA